MRFHYEVVVVGHEAVAQAAEVGSLHDAIEAVEEVASIAIKAEDGLPVASPRVDVVDPSGDELTVRSSHGRDDRSLPIIRPTMWTNRSCSGTT